jgi:hypothetical protein
VPSADQRSDLDRRIARLAEDTAAAGLVLSRVVSEVGSALNDNRPKLRRLLVDSGVVTIVEEHRDRLARFGVEHVEAALAAQDRSRFAPVSRAGYRWSRNQPDQGFRWYRMVSRCRLWQWVPCQMRAGCEHVAER